MKDAAKDFGPITSDYDFFMAHATEAEGDVRDYLPHLERFAEHGGPIRLLDFGCNAGDFTRKLLSRLAWPADRLQLTLVEPVEAGRAQAAKQLAEFSAAPIQDGPDLQAVDA